VAGWPPRRTIRISDSTSCPQRHTYSALQTASLSLIIVVLVFVLFSSSIRPSLEQDSGIDNNTGSLPNLSDLQFGVGGSSDDVLDTMGYHSIGPMRVSGSQGSPGSRHRRARTGPKPLFLPSSSSVAQYQVPNISVLNIVKANDAWCCFILHSVSYIMRFNYFRGISYTFLIFTSCHVFVFIICVYATSCFLFVYNLSFSSCFVVSMSYLLCLSYFLTVIA